MQLHSIPPNDLLINNSIPRPTTVLHFHLDKIPMAKPSLLPSLWQPHPGGRTGHDNRSTLESGSLAKKADDSWHIEQQIASIGMLPLLAVDPGP